MDILGKLFGSENKVKMMRLFLFNPDIPFTPEAVADRSKASLYSTKQELAILRQMKLLKNRAFFAKITKGKKGKHFERKV